MTRDLVLMTSLEEYYMVPLGFPGDSDGKESACNAGDPGLDPWISNSYPLQCSCLEDPTDREAWQATIYGAAQSWS